METLILLRFKHDDDDDDEDDDDYDDDDDDADFISVLTRADSHKGRY